MFVNLRIFASFLTMPVVALVSFGGLPQILENRRDVASQDILGHTAKPHSIVDGAKESPAVSYRFIEKKFPGSRDDAISRFPVHLGKYCMLFQKLLTRRTNPRSVFGA